MQSLWRLIAVAVFLAMSHINSASAEESGGFDESLGLDSLLNIEISAASKYAQGIHEAPAAVTVITADEISLHGYRTLEDVLQNVRGFYISNDRNYAYLGVRGFSRPTDYNDRVVLLLNGHSMNENVYGAAFIGTELALDLGHIERIEIIRGPGSALYGTNAMFAVINLVTKDGKTLDGGRARLDAGSYGHVGGAVEYGRLLDNGLDWSVNAQWADANGQRLFYPEYNSPATNFGVTEHDDGDAYHSLTGSLAYKHATLQFALTDRIKHVPTGAYESDFGDAGFRTKDQRGFLEVKLDHPWGDNRQFMGRIYYDNYFYEGNYPYEADQTDQSDGDWVGGEVQLRWDPRPDNRLILGIEHQNNLRADYALWDEDTTYFDGDFPFALWSAYIQDEAQLTGELAVTAGVRHDYNSAYGSTTTPRGALVFSHDPIGTLKLMYGDAYRSPNVYEREIGGGEFVKSNPDLEPERIRTFELAWEYPVGRHIRGCVSIFNNDLENLIDQVIDPADSLEVFSNVGEAHAIGTELELSGRWEGGLSLTLSYSYQEAKDPETDSPLTNSPNHRANAIAVVPAGRHLTLAARGLYESKRLTVYDTWTDPFFIAGLTTTIRPRMARPSSWSSLLERASLSLTINNLFNEDYKTPGGYEHRQAAISQNGRNILVQLKVDF